MPDDLTFDIRPPARSGECIRVSPLVRRIVAGNPGPITFTGTCSYIVGSGNVAIIDPGPDLPGHIEALLDAVRGETVSHILVTHTHKDHSPAARAIKAATGRKDRRLRPASQRPAALLRRDQQPRGELRQGLRPRPGA